MKVDDMVIAEGKAWKICGVYLGPAGGQNLIGLRNLNPLVGLSGDGEMLVPKELIDGRVYTPVA